MATEPHVSSSGWLRLAFSDGIPRRAAIVALVVGPLLTAINQGDALVGGEGLDWIKVGLTFLVPYAVATFGAVGARRSTPQSTRARAIEAQPTTSTTTAPAPCKPGEARLSSARLGPDDSGVKGVKARVHVTLKNGVLDPQGKAIEQALTALGFEGVEDVRQGKVIEFTLPGSDPAAARATVESMCEKLLANTVIENYAIDLDS